ncbi:MAG: ABC transporter ATP-binding protein [Candidatus Gracilibacteria bacterium]|nr:ABC transporter ATP-binding protein [Candidatus Gracilibacteria bacterium]
MIDILSTINSINKESIISGAIKIVLLILALRIFTVIIWRFFDYAITRLELNVMKDIYLKCFDYLHRHSQDFFNNTFTGSLVKKVNKLVGGYEKFIDILFFDILSTSFDVFIIMIFLFRESVTIGLIFLIWIVVHVFLQFILYKRIYKYEISSNEYDSRISGFLADTITNNYNIKIFGSLKREFHNFTNITSDWQEITGKCWILSSWARGFSGFIVNLVQFIIIYICIVSLDKGIITIGTIFLVQMYIISISQRMWDLSRVFRRINQFFGESSEMIEILETKHSIKDKENAIELKVSLGEIEFKNVTFGYKNGANVFDDLNFKIKPKEKVALIGLSGAGKSTIVKLLLRFHDINDGQILIDGQNIENVTQDSLRQNISVVPQDVVLFHRSLFENMKYGNPEATKEQVVEVSKLARCHEFISKLKYGYDTFVGERGVKLSGGEKQRVAIARALLENAKIFLLDEATSSLDSESEKLIQEAIDVAMKNKTTIVIAHRLSTVMKMDRIIVLEDGKIVEEGSHKQLLTKKNGKYKKLWDIQSGSFLGGNEEEENNFSLEKEFV